MERLSQHNSLSLSRILEIRRSEEQVARSEKVRPLYIGGRGRGQKVRAQRSASNELIAKTLEKPRFTEFYNQKTLKYKSEISQIRYI
jgi:hypothetical protein